MDDKVVLFNLNNHNYCGEEEINGLTLELLSLLYLYQYCKTEVFV